MARPLRLKAKSGGAGGIVTSSITSSCWAGRGAATTGGPQAVGACRGWRGGRPRRGRGKDGGAAPARWQSQVWGQFKVQVSRFEAINRHTLRLTPHVNHEVLGSCLDDTEGSVIGRS